MSGFGGVKEYSDLCSGCPPLGSNKSRCKPCPRRDAPQGEPDDLVERLRNVTEEDAYAAPWTFGELCREAADRLAASEARAETLESIYIASKTVHGPRWQRLRSEGVPFISSWIDEYYPGATEDWADLWTRCVTEAASATALILYREPGEVLKGAWLEAGAALSHGVPVFAVGCEEFNARHHPNIHLCADFDTALCLAKLRTPPPSRPDGGDTQETPNG